MKTSFKGAFVLRVCVSFLHFSSPLLFLINTSCGSENVFETLEKKDDKDKAKKSLQNGDYDKAIQSLQSYLADHPNDAGARAMLANAYMKKAGIDILGLAAKVTSSGASSWKGILGALPKGTDDNVTALKGAVEALKAIPAASRTAEQSYQLVLAQTSLAVTIAKKAAGEGESVSEAKVAAMSDKDANLVYTSLQDSASTVAASPGLGDNASAQKLAGLNAKVDAQTGASTADKMRAFLISQK
jgi:hypothetical protein